MSSEREELDALLESGIASYADAEPLAGMEERILARIRLAEKPRRGWNAWRAVLGLGLAGLVVAALLWVRTPRDHPQTSAIAAVRKSPVVEVQMPARASRIAKPKHRAGVRALPKQKVFPTPVPPSKEERLLAAMLARDPALTIQTFESLRKKAEAPIEISQIAIAPLAGNENQ